MITSSRRKRLQSQTPRPVKSAFLSWLESQVVTTKFNLSDQFCCFLIDTTYQIRGNNVIIDIYCKPYSGVFAFIEFRPKILVSLTNFIQRPRIYNNFRLFHPNINIYSCEFVSPQLIIQWNPAKEFSGVLRHLKKIICQPDCRLVANNLYNRKAAWQFHFNSRNYPPLIEHFSPEYLQNVASEYLDHEMGVMMQVENEEKEVVDYNDYWGIELAIAKGKVITLADIFEKEMQDKQDKQKDQEEYDEQKEQEIEFLSRKIKKLEVKSELIEECVFQ